MIKKIMFIMGDQGSTRMIKNIMFIIGGQVSPQMIKKIMLIMGDQGSTQMINKIFNLTTHDKHDFFIIIRVLTEPPTINMIFLIIRVLP
jgi:hypothetical protein